MRIAIVGAGIIGVTSAYELGAEGHDVTVFERRSSVAEETSFANAGLVAPGYVTPWAAPGMPMKVLCHLGSRHRPVRMHVGVDLGWAWQWWRACRLRTYQANRLRLHRLAVFSRERLQQLTSTLHIDYERRQGYLVLLRTSKELALAQPGLETLATLGTRHAVLDADQCRRVEPGLDAQTPLHAGIHLPDDEVGNCRQFALLLRREAEKHGVRFRFDTTVQRIEAGPAPRVVHLRAGHAATAPPAQRKSVSDEWPDTRPQPHESITESFDAIIVCAALGAPALLRPLGVNLPLQAVYGYSITAPLRRDDQIIDPAPRSALMDERYKVAISRLGNRVRVAGSAEVGGARDKINPHAVATLYKVLDDWFPGAAHASQAQVWKGARPMLPDGPPVLGASGVDGILLNLGHGSSGWALACGSARLLAAAVAARPAPIDTEGLGIERLWA